jgi:Aldo/keto reductase family
MPLLTLPIQRAASRLTANEAPSLQKGGTLAMKEFLMKQTTSIESATIPGTTLHPSRIALGTWAIGGWMWGGTDDAQAIATIKSAIDRGITLIDTAPAYGFGHAEELVGQALAEAKAQTGSASRPRSGWIGTTAKYSATPPARASARRSRIRCGVYGRMLSTSIRCTGLTPKCRSMRPRKQCSSSIAPERSARSG